MRRSSPRASSWIWRTRSRVSMSREASCWSVSNSPPFKPKRRSITARCLSFNCTSHSRTSDSIADESSVNPELRLHPNEIQSLRREWLVQLNDKQRAVIERRFGLNGRELLTLQQLASQLMLTRER